MNIVFSFWKVRLGRQRLIKSLEFVHWPRKVIQMKRENVVERGFTINPQKDFSLNAANERHAVPYLRDQSMKLPIAD